MADPRKQQHGTAKRYEKGCRCDECRQVATQKKMRWQKGWSEDEADLEHGTEAGYQRGCRCSKCRSAGEPFPHGERRGYRRGCRCEACKSGRSQYEAGRVAAKDKSAADFPHGTRRGARNGCKCESCMNAKREHEKAYIRTKESESEEFRRKRRVAGLVSQNKRQSRLSVLSQEQDLIRAIYANCPEGYEVDHIVPLSVGGTNETANLQYLPAWVNRRKSSNADLNCSEYAIPWQDLVQEPSTTISQESRLQAEPKRPAPYGVKI